MLDNIAGTVDNIPESNLIGAEAMLITAGKVSS
jgi:hypothetical protein